MIIRQFVMICFYSYFHNRMESNQDIKMLLVTLNVGTIFEEPNLMQGWSYELSKLFKEQQPGFIGMSFQVYIMIAF